MQIVNPLRAALPYITLQTAKVQHCWADYFIFRGFAGAAGRFGSAETRRRSLRQPPQGAGDGPPPCSRTLHRPRKNFPLPIANYTEMVYYIAVIKSREHFPAILYR